MDQIQAIMDRMKLGNVPVQRITVKENQVFALTASELLACCDKHPNHPSAAVFRSAVANLPPDHEVHVDRIDLDALLSDREVVITSEQSVQHIDGEDKLVTTERKVLQE